MLFFKANDSFITIYFLFVQLICQFVFFLFYFFDNLLHLFFQFCFLLINFQMFGLNILLSRHYLVALFFIRLFIL